MITEFKKRGRLLERKRHFKTDFDGSLSVLRLIHLGYVVRNGQGVVSLDWHERFS